MNEQSNTAHYVTIDQGGKIFGRYSIMPENADRIELFGRALRQVERLPLLNETHINLETGEFMEVPPDPPTLDELKDTAKAVINAKRLEVTDGGITFNGVRYQTRTDDRENMAGAVQLANMALAQGKLPGDLRWNDGLEDFTWIAEDNSLVPMDAPTVVSFGVTAAKFKGTVIKNARRLKDEIDAAADEKALQTIDTSAGWPIG